MLDGAGNFIFLKLLLYICSYLYDLFYVLQIFSILVTKDIFIVKELLNYLESLYVIFLQVFHLLLVLLFHSNFKFLIFILQNFSACTQHPLEESEAELGHMSIVTTFCHLTACFYDRSLYCCQGACACSPLNARINSGGLIWVGTWDAYWNFSGFSRFWPL